MRSPYSRERVLCCILKGYTSKFEERSESNYADLMHVSETLLGHIPGKAGLFLPSYEVLEELHETGMRGLDRVFLWERGGMSSEENRQLLNTFRESHTSRNVTLVAVAGGRSSERVDFPEGQMNAAIMMGIPFPKPTPRVRRIVRRLELKFPGKGWTYGYVVPSLARAAQAVGRATRTPKRKAAIMLVDDRYERPHILGCLPEWLRALVWQQRACTIDAFVPILDRFWATES